MIRVRLVVLALLCLFCAAYAHASLAAASPCPRFGAGSTLVEPKDLYSNHGLLRVNLTYETRTDASGNVLFCFTTEDGAQSPTFHLHPGDELMITLKNNLPPAPPMEGMNAKADSVTAMPGMSMPDLAISASSAQCTASIMTANSVNMHFHGTNVKPTCHQDEVIKTLVNGGESFTYDVHVPLDEPSGLYWYHPHVHGSSEAAVQGGASGAIVVEGIQNVIPEAAGLPQRLLIVRDNLVPGDPDDLAPDAPAWDVSLNYAPVTYPKYTPVRLPVRPKQKELWRVLNAAADTILDLQVQYDGGAQPLKIVALDGVPTRSQDGTTGGQPISREHILVPPAGRVEFIITTPDAKVKSAQLVTLNVDTGPDGDNDPVRPLARLETSANAAVPVYVPAVDGPPVARARFAELRAATPTVHRKLYFSEVISDPSDPDSPTNFYITVDGHKPVLFSPDNPPAIVTTQGAVEDWTIENRAGENHEFHIHQIHFLVLEKNHLPVDGEYLDTINVPYWTGSGPYPAVKLRMDFRGNVVGDFVYHCHILGHEDGGMMAVVRVLPK